VTRPFHWDPNDHTQVSVLIEHKRPGGHVLEERRAGQVRYYPRARIVFAGPFDTFADAETVLATKRPPAPPELDYYALREATIRSCG
jgi:hypothetical protein